MSDEKVAIVTGANKGIGLATIKLLCQRFPDWTVYLTARDAERGQRAVDELKNAFNINPKFCQLDVVSKKSVRDFANFLRENHPRGIDILVNNAGVAALDGAFRGEEAKTKIDREKFRLVVETNYFGLVNVSTEILPLLKDGARVVNVSSGLAQIVFEQFSASLQKKFEQISSEAELSSLIEKFVAIEDGEVRSEGWLSGDHLDQVASRWNRTGLEILPYGVSKLAINVLTALQQKQFDASPSKKNVAVNACTPGGIKTDMNVIGTKLPEDGADVYMYLATIPHDDGQIRGKYVDSNKKVADLFRMSP